MNRLAAMITRMLVALCCALWIGSLPATAGNTGTLRGRVVSDNGVYRRATVRVASPSAVETTVSDKNGFFVFISLPPDVYLVDAQATGFFHGCERHAVTVMSDQASEVLLRLFRFYPDLCVADVKRQTPASPQTAVTADLYDIF